MIDDIDAIEKKINEKYATSNDKRLVPDILINILRRLDRIESLLKNQMQAKRKYQNINTARTLKPANIKKN